MGAALFVGLGLGFWQQASGSEAAVYYSPHVLEVRERRALQGVLLCVVSQPACMRVPVSWMVSWLLACLHACLV